MKYLQKTFTVGGHTDAYSDGWERVFGKKGDNVSETTQNRPALPRCCWISRDNEQCEDAAEWEVWDGVEPYFDHSVDACTEHVGALLTDRPEHRVFRIGKF